MTTTMEVSETLERVDNIVNMLDEICDQMDGFSSAEEAWLSSCALGVCDAGNPRKPGIRRSPRSLWVHLDLQMLGYRTRRGQGLR
jgi:hypothetical protein